MENPTTLQSILSGLLLMHKRHRAFLQKMLRNTSQKNPRFETLHNTMDIIYRVLGLKELEQRHIQQSLSQRKKRTCYGLVVFFERMILWHCNVYAVFYYNGKVFCLRGGHEHRSLALSQLKRIEDGCTQMGLKPSVFRPKTPAKTRETYCV